MPCFIKLSGYRDWRTQHGQGGDFMIYTEPHSIRLDTPIQVQLV